jgi:hypothetical protein
MKKAILFFLLMVSGLGFSQVTKSSISGTVKSNKGELLPGVNVEVIHQPTGTKYYASTNAVGDYSISAIRPGGPYIVKASFVGFKTAEEIDVNAPLGNSITVNLVLQDEMTVLQEVVVKSTKINNNVFNKGKTGASQQFSTRELNSIPVTGSRNISAITKYNANAGSGGTFGGQDSRLNNFTIDGSVFNDGFGLGSGGAAGGRTGSTAISLDAIEQLQVNIAPFDVRQSGFVGSGINAVTRSGTNEIEGSAYYSWRSNKPGYIGKKAGNVKITPGEFDENIKGLRLGFPLLKNKLFFFGNAEFVDGISPATTWISTGSPNVGSQLAEVNYTDLVNVSNELKKAFGYETGPFEAFDSKRVSRKYLGRLDWNINNNHKLSLRYVHHDSEEDALVSNSATLGQGNRRTSINSISYKNSGYTLQDNTRSIVLEMDSKLSDKWSNNFIAGYDMQIENRGLQGGGIFPTIDILNGVDDTNPATGPITLGSANYISAGLDPFTPGNLLDYSTLHFTNNVTGNFGNHTLLFGANYDRFVSNNLFFSGSNGVYIYNSVQEFINAVNVTTANNNAPTNQYLPLRFQYRYSALAGGADPLQVLKSNKLDLYVQDEYKPWDNLKLTFGLRATGVDLENTALENPIVSNLTFREGQKLNTGRMPKTQYLFEPRLGFNLDLNSNGNVIIRGGTGVFTGRPPYVLLSNAIGNNGILTGFTDVSGTNLASGFDNDGNPSTNPIPYGFTPNPQQYFTPTNPSSNLPTQLDLAFTDTDYKFPQVWKTTIAVDAKLPFGFRGTIEGIFNKNINEIFYYNANFSEPVGSISNAGDNRPFFGGTDNIVRINDNVSNAIVLSNSNEGYFYSTTFKLEYPYKNGLWGNIAYTHSNAKDLLSAGNSATSSWTGTRSLLGNNNLSLSDSNNNTPHRIVGTIGYKIEYGKGGGGAATSFNIGYIGEKANPFTYGYNNDINGDRINGNDLLYVPNSAADLRFADIVQTINGVSQVIFTAAEQVAAFDKYIEQDDYLRTRRGQYVERNAVVLPWLHKFDVSVTQDFFLKIAGKKQTFQFRVDLINAGNLLNSDWGVSQRVSSTNILNVSTAPTAANNYTPIFQLQTQTDDYGRRYLSKDTFQYNSSVFDVWQAQFSLRYIFGK